MEGKFILLNVCLLLIMGFLVLNQYKKVYETYSDYFNEDLFRTLDYDEDLQNDESDNIIEIAPNNNGFRLNQSDTLNSYSDDPEALKCFDRYKSAQELGVVSANKLYATEKKEISKGKFIKILDELKETYKVLESNLNLVNQVICQNTNNATCIESKPLPISISTYDLAKKWVLARINEKMVEYDQTTDYDHIPFEIQRDTNLKFKQIQDSTNNIDYFKFLMSLHREGKNKVFTIQSDVFYDKNNSEIVIIELKLDGLTTNENSASGFMEFHRNAYYACDDNGVSCTLSDRPECKPPSSDSVMETREAEAAETRRILNSKCFYKEAENQAECISIDVSGCSGVWDTKCSADTDCPFFGANGNINYENNRGGCKSDGHCELPLNMIGIGYTKYSPRTENRPLCHNCPKIPNCIGKECSQCCDLQGDKPDYAFEFDKPFRKNAREELESQGLKYFDIHF